MNILKYKYKAHKLINYAFYVIVFLIGFVLGFGAKKIDFNKLVSQVLMIDSVSAYTMEIDYDNEYFTQINTNLDLNRKYAYLKEKFLDSKEHINHYVSYYYDNKIVVTYSTNTSSTNGLIDSHVNFGSSNLYFSYGSGYNQDISVFELNLNNDYTEFKSLVDNLNNYTIDDTSYLKFYTSAFSGMKNIFTSSSSESIYKLSSYNKTSSIYTYNLIMPFVIDSKNIKLLSYYRLSSDTLIIEDETIKNSTTFKSYWDYKSDEVVNLEYNENLFKDNENFKEVCIEKGKKYGITTTNIDPISNTAFVSDFIWFPGKTTGVKYSEYDSLNDNNILIFNDDISTENYYFEDKDKIDSFYNNEIISNYFNHSGYTDKYSYYGYTAYKFMHSYYVDENDNPQNMFTIFDFSDINFSVFGSAGGSSSSFGDNPLTYCFYIKNEFNVTELKTDEWNDYTGVVPTPGGNLDVNTSYNKNNSNTEDFLSQPIKFIDSMKNTINLINSLIYEFYMSLPVLLRTFIITVLIILIIMLIMKIGGYK